MAGSGAGTAKRAPTPAFRGVSSASRRSDTDTSRALNTSLSLSAVHRVVRSKATALPALRCRPHTSGVALKWPTKTRDLPSPPRPTKGDQAFLEATPRALADLEFNFNSRVTPDEPGLLIENHCTYALRGNNTHSRPRLLISIEDSTLAQSLFGESGLTEIRSWTRADKPEFRASRSALGFSLGTTRVLVSATTPTGPVLVATLPITFFVDR